MRVTTARRASTLASASASRRPSPDGYGETINVPERPVSFSQISSVRNGMNGCSSASEPSRQRRSTPARRLRGLRVRAREGRLDHLEIAVAELVPDERVDRLGRLVEAERLEVAVRRRPRSPRGATGSSGPARLSVRPARSSPGCSPSEQGQERTGAPRSRPSSRSCASRPCAPARPRPSGPEDAAEASVNRTASAPNSWIASSGSMTLPLVFDIFSPPTAHEAVQVDRVERRLVREAQSRHDHPGHPEEEDVVARDEHVGRIEVLRGRGLVGPAEHRERPELRTRTRCPARPGPA